MNQNIDMNLYGQANNKKSMKNSIKVNNGDYVDGD